jgi:hypothetical protein
MRIWCIKVGIVLVLHETPFKQRFRRIPPPMLDEMKKHIEQQLTTGIIRRSHSPFISNVVLVRKKDDQLRNLY